jgi:hypothetical protein
MQFFQTGPMKKLITKGVKSMESSDVALTYWHEKEMIAVLDQNELLIQLKYWKKNNMEVRKSNVRQYDVGGKSVYLFVVQPVDEELLAECNICPFSASLGLMVAGVGYVCTSRATLDLIIRYIGVEGATKNPIFQ